MQRSLSTLNAKQLRWIDEYLVDFNGAAAAVRAGYSSKSARFIAHENATKPHIQAVLKARQAGMAREFQITREGVVRGLLDAFEMAKTDGQPSTMVSASSAIAKLLGFYAVETKRVVLTPDQCVFQAGVAALNDAQLLALIAQGNVAA